MSHHGLAPKERGLPPVQCSFIGSEAILPARRGARARRARAHCNSPTARALRHLPTESGRSGALVCARRESRLRKVKASAGTSHHGLTEKERGLPPVQCFFTGLGATPTTCVVRRVRAASASVAHSRVRDVKAGFATWRPRLGRRTTVLRRMRKASRRSNVLC